jgi:hypothetical protein
LLVRLIAYLSRTEQLKTPSFRDTLKDSAASGIALALHHVYSSMLKAVDQSGAARALGAPAGTPSGPQPGVQRFGRSERDPYSLKSRSDGKQHITSA